MTKSCIIWSAIPETGKVLKLMIDSLPDLTIIATASSSFDLLNKAGEPLTGRKIQFQLYPVAQLELESRENFVETRQHLEERLVFGSYPEMLQLPSYRVLSVFTKDNYLDWITGGKQDTGSLFLKF